MSEESYKRVNGAWPATVPPRKAGWCYKHMPTNELTGKEAVAAAKRLYRVAMKRPFRGDFKITSGNRNTWIRSGVFYVNAETGWRNLVHDISHFCFYQLHPGKKPHDWRHAMVEKELIEHVVSNGWLEGKLRKREKPVGDVKATRYERILKRIENWESKAQRAERALKKLRLQKKYYEKTLELDKPKKRGRPKNPPIIFKFDDDEPSNVTEMSAYGL